MNTCDHNHQTPGEIRQLPIGFDPHHGNMLVCRRHFEAEIEYRRERAKFTGADKWRFPKWEDLTIESAPASRIATSRRRRNW